MPNYFVRVQDYLCDPFFPSEDRFKPLVIAEALWHCLWNNWVYDDEKLMQKIEESSRERSLKATGKFLGLD